MRLVPKYLLIGAGRMAKHFSYYLTLLDLPFLQWSRKNNSIENLSRYTKECSHILLLINDDAIESFISHHDFLLSKRCVHFSGSLITENIFSAHPLMTFSSELYNLDIYRDIPFILENEGADLIDLLPGLPNQSFKIDKKLKPFYHALLVIGCNFTTLLWQNVFQSLQKDLHLPQETTYPILKQTMHNLLTQPNDALTGPLVRNDINTIQKHLQALKDKPLNEIYQAFVDFFNNEKINHEHS